MLLHALFAPFLQRVQKVDFCIKALFVFTYKRSYHILKVPWGSTLSHLNKIAVFLC